MKTNVYNLLNLSTKSVLFIFMFLLFNQFYPSMVVLLAEEPPEVQTDSKNSEKIATNPKVKDIFDNRRCPCQCNNYLPGSNKTPVCFGCSVGKTELAYIDENLNAGATPREIIISLTSPILINVFSDYTNIKIPKVWDLTKKVAKELGQVRVVLRAPALTTESRRAITLVEFARQHGKFSVIQEALIYHNGPWDKDTLIQLATQHGLNKEQVTAGLNNINTKAQILKDQHHAMERGIIKFPTISINREVIENSEYAVRNTIKSILLKKSIWYGTW